MFCPECKFEYKAGVTICSDCNVPLVKKLTLEAVSQLEAKPQQRQKLRYATLAVIIGISYIFVLKTAGTFSPGIFINIYTAQVTQLLSFLTGLTVLFFFISFHRYYIEEAQTELKKVTALNIIGTSALLLLHIKGLILVFRMYISPYLVSCLTESHLIEPVITWVSSIFTLLFFIAFHRETLSKEAMKLRKAVFFAVIGSSIAVLMQTFVLFNYFLARESRWFSDRPIMTASILVPVAAFSIITVLYFLVSFYLSQDDRSEGCAY
ncbi:MAG: hypothetical protein P9X24_01525 [Candidatus Hatepunaea meridiana]|nr:hypothetical protein [Candidatus Hatepunaea meridiana]